MAARSTRRRRNTRPLTAKQEQARELAEAGYGVNEIARQMGIKPTGVYGHLRKLRDHGIGLSVPTVGIEGSRVVPPAAANGSADVIERRVIESVKAAVEEFEEFVTGLDRRIEEGETMLTALKSERETADQKRTRYRRAAESLVG